MDVLLNRGSAWEHSGSVLQPVQQLADSRHASVNGMDRDETKHIKQSSRKSDTLHIVTVQLSHITSLAI